MSYKSPFYGDTMRWFIGVVEEVGNDVPRLGRAKVRIYGVHADASEISTSDLPYAQVLVPTTEGGSSGIGQNPNLMVGSQVFGIFLDGVTSQLPLIIGSIPKIEVPSSEQIDSLITDPKVGALIQNTNQGITAAYFQQVNSSINPGSTNISYAWEYFTLFSFPPVAIAAILGNFWVESCGNVFGDLEPRALFGCTIAENTDSTKATGIAQWIGTRLEALKKFASTKPSYGNHLGLIMQLEWVMEELKGEYRSALGVKQITNVADATVFWQHRYEKNNYKKDANGKPIRSKYIVQGMRINERVHEAERIHHAERIYTQFTGKNIGTA